MTRPNLITAVLLMILSAFVSGSCVGDRGSYTPDIPKHNVATSTDGIVARVLVPAGSSVNQGIRGGHDEPKPIDFLPYPGNWAELIKPIGHSFHVMILTDALAKGSTLGIKPIAVLQLDSAGVQRDIIIAIPNDSLLMSLQINGFVDLITDYEPVRHILQTWFVNYRGFGAFEVVGWRDEAYALKLLSPVDR